MAELTPTHHALALLLFAESTAATVSKALQLQGIPHLFAKGFAAAHTLYPDPLQRSFQDVDVFVPWSQFRAARNALEKAGLSQARHLATSHSCIWRSPLLQEGPDIDLQGWLAYPLVPPAGWQMLLQRATTIQTSSGSLPVPEPLDMACLSALFALRDRLRPSTATLMRDVEQAMSRFGSSALLIRARQLGLRRAVSLVLSDRKHRRGPSAVREVFGWLDQRFPRGMSALPALLLDRPLIAGASFLVSASVLGVEHALRK